MGKVIAPLAGSAQTEHSFWTLMDTFSSSAFSLQITVRQFRHTIRQERSSSILFAHFSQILILISSPSRVENLIFAVFSASSLQQVHFSISASRLSVCAAILVRDPLVRNFLRSLSVFPVVMILLNRLLSRQSGFPQRFLPPQNYVPKHPTHYYILSQAYSPGYSGGQAPKVTSKSANLLYVSSTYATKLLSLLCSKFKVLCTYRT